jgi:hypothetical protein
MAAAIAALQDAVRADESQSEPAGEGGEENAARPGITLRQRVWPVIDMLKRAQSARQPVVWGV